MHITRSSAFVLLASVWSTAATAITPATTEQIVCSQAVFVVATVTDESPSVSVPESCKEGGRHRFFCDFEWPLAIKVDQVLAVRPSNFSPEEMSGFQSGRTLRVGIGVVGRLSDATATVEASRNSGGIAPDDSQGRMWTPLLSGDESTTPLRRKKFIFGLVDFGGRTSIWSMSFRERLEKALTEYANGQQRQFQCPRLVK